MFSRIDGKTFFVDKITASSTNTSNISVVEVDGRIVSLGSVYNSSLDIKRTVKALIKTSPYGLYVYSVASPYKYRISGGRLYQQEKNVSDEWSPVQKIKLGTCDIYNGDIATLDIRSAPSLVWQTDGNRLSTLG